MTPAQDRAGGQLKRCRIPSPSSEPLGGETHHQHPPKKQKLHHPAFPPPRFWDNLSETHLTRNALRELGRRNAEASRQERRERARRPPSPQCKINLQNLDRLKERSSSYHKQLHVFARHGGPDLRDLRGYQPPTPSQVEMDSSQNSSQSPSAERRRKRGSGPSTKNSSHDPTTTSATPHTGTKSTGPYDRAFLQHLTDHDVLPVGYEYPDGRLSPEPDNMDEIRRALAQPRRSLSPSRCTNDDFRKFDRADTRASKERDVATNVIPLIEGDVGDPRRVAGSLRWSNLNHLTDGSIVPGNPDIYYGARPEQLDVTVRNELDKIIVPTTQKDMPIAPNFGLEIKGPRGDLWVATTQACYTGALMARGIQSIQSYGQTEQHFDNKAYTITSTYHSGVLRIYATHPIPPSAPNKRPGFVMTQLKVICLTGDADTFRQGTAAYRNGRDWAKQQRDSAIEQANRRAAAMPSGRDDLAMSFSSEASAVTVITSQATAHDAGSHPVSYESETSGDPVMVDQPSAKRAKPCSAEEREE